MARVTRTWVAIVAGVAILLVVVGLGVGVVSIVWLRENTTFERGVEAAHAEGAFAAALRRFPDPRPALELGEDRRPQTAPGAARRNPGQITTLHVLAWDPEERALAEVTLPFWLVRLKSGPIGFGGHVSGFDDHGVQFTAEQIERLGPGVLVDFRQTSGERVLLFAH